jgi:hypothetical protein
LHIAYNIENILYHASNVPVIGAIPGAVIVALGAIQAVGATFVGLAALVLNKKALTEHSWTHLKHGLYNISGGVQASIPIFQTDRYRKSLECQGKGRADGITIVTGHEHKYYPYIPLVVEDMRIKGKVSPDNEEDMYVMYEAPLKAQQILEN